MDIFNSRVLEHLVIDFPFRLISPQQRKAAGCKSTELWGVRGGNKEVLGQ